MRRLYTVEYIARLRSCMIRELLAEGRAARDADALAEEFFAKYAKRHRARGEIELARDLEAAVMNERSMRSVEQCGSSWWRWFRRA